MGFWEGSGISWTVCKQSAPHSRQTTSSLNFYRSDALPDAQLTVSKQRRHYWLITHTQTSKTRLTAPFPGLPRWASTRKVKPIWILLKQETEWHWHQWGASLQLTKQITTQATRHSVFMPFLLCRSTEGMHYWLVLYLNGFEC